MAFTVLCELDAMVIVAEQRRHLNIMLVFTYFMHCTTLFFGFPHTPFPVGVYAGIVVICQLLAKLQSVLASHSLPSGTFCDSFKTFFSVS